MLTNFAASLITGVIILLIGGLVYSANRKNRINKIFFLLTIAIFLWIFSVSFRFINATNDLVFVSIKASYAVMSVVIYLFAYFSYIFPAQNQYNFRTPILMSVTAVFFFLSLFSSYIVKDVVLESGKQINVFGPYIYAFGIYFTAYIGLGIYNLDSKRHYLDRISNKQIDFVIAGTILSAVFGFSSNFIIPTITKMSATEVYGPLAILFLITFTSYAILKHHLFNIRLITTELITFAIWGFVMARILASASFREYVINGFFLAFLLAFGLLLIRSVRKEVEQREKLELLTKELEDKNVKLQELDRVRSEFLSFASHQVKAPMTAVKGYASLIYEGTYGEAAQGIKDAAWKIKVSADRLIELVNNLLNLRSIEEGKWEYNFDKIELNKFLNEIAEDFKLLAKNKELELNIKLPAKKIFINADQQKLRQVVQNLADNAIKYTEKGWINIELENKDEENALICVSDSGRGISKELLPNLFKQFSRDHELAKELQGTGLGLYIAKTIIEAHKGKIWAESAGLNQGSAFYIKLPIAS